MSELSVQRLSRCSACGKTKVADPSSKYFQSRPDHTYDSDWDGCTEGAGT